MTTTNLTLVWTPCSTCELLAFWNAWIAWDEESARLWDGWPDDDEGDPPGAAEHRERMPQGPPWAASIFEYADEPGAVLRNLRCALHHKETP